jgi:hypothetical protein
MTNASRVGAICAVGAMCAVGVWLGLRAQTASAPQQTATVDIPNFAPDDQTSWRLNRIDGDNWLPPEGGGPGPIVAAPEYPYVPNNDDYDQPTYRIGDLTNPILQPWVRAQMQRDNDEVLAGKVPFMARERCYPPGMAWNVFRRVGEIFIVQQPQFVLLIWRGDNQFRHVYLNVPHSANPKPSWNGESVGYYEGGNTLVVDTIGVLVHPYNFVDNYRTPFTDQLHVVERYRISPDGKTMDVRVHFEDPGAFTIPWEARQRWVRRSERSPLYEHICADGEGRGVDAFYWGVTRTAGLAPIPQDETPDFYWGVSHEAALAPQDDTPDF